MSVSRTTPDSISSEETKHPLWRMEDWLRIAKENDWEVHANGNDVSVVILGEKHLPEYAAKEMELVRKSHPKAILCEALQGLVYDPVSDTLYNPAADPPLPIPRSWHKSEQIAPLLEWAHKNQVPVIGVDVAFGNEVFETLNEEQKQTMELLKAIGADPMAVYEGTAGAAATSSQGMKIRSKKMAEKIISQIERGNGPVVAITGAAHIDGIHQHLIQAKKEGFISGHVAIKLTKPYS